MRIGIKLGSSLLTDGRGNINENIILEVCRQVSELKRVGHEVFIVSSGAVASDPKKYRSSNLRSGIGQPKLMERYVRFFEIFKIEASQHLLTDREILGENKVTRATLLEAFSEKVVPIINGNDVVDNKELKALEVCADNDRLFQLVSILVKADIGIIGFSESGLLDKNQQVIHEVASDEVKKVLVHAKTGSKLGHGNDGMKTKIRTLVELSRHGTRAVLAPGKEKDFILRAAAGEKDFGTKFLK
jgi:glutamate 5-kinase